MLFISPKKLFLFWGYSHFCAEFFGYGGRFILKLMTSQPGKQIVTVHLLRENNKLNIFLKKSYARCGGETSPRESRTSTKCYLNI